MTPDCVTAAHFWQDPPCQDRSDDFAEPRGQTVRAISRRGNEKERERQSETMKRERERVGGGGVDAPAHVAPTHCCRISVFAMNHCVTYI